MVGRVRVEETADRLEQQFGRDVHTAAVVPAGERRMERPLHRAFIQRVAEAPLHPLYFAAVADYLPRQIVVYSPA